jgi:hypothetical protein
MTFIKSLSHLSFAAVPMLFVTVALSQTPMYWTYASGNRVPRDATPVATDSRLLICMAQNNSGAQAGSLQADGSHIGLDGRELVRQTYCTLSGDGMWVPSDQDRSAVFPAGEENRTPLLLCRARFNDRDVSWQSRQRRLFHRRGRRRTADRVWL